MIRVGFSIAAALVLLAGCLAVSKAATRTDARCAIFDTTFEAGAVTGLRIYGDRHGTIVYVPGCPEVDLGVHFAPGVWDDPAHAEFRAYFYREMNTSRRSATLDVIADLDPAVSGEARIWSG